VPGEKKSLAKSPEVLIVSLARTGDHDAFAELVRRRQAWIRNLMRRCCGDETLGDDLAQQVFLQALQDIRRLRDPRKFNAWLKTLAINIWRRHLRKNDALKFSTEQSEFENTRRDAIGVGMDLEGALATLSAAVRLCVVLFAHEGMTHAEISKHTDLPLGTVKSHIRRGTQRLQQLLNVYADGSAEEEPS
jgi:RNA polymerase sigma-70 factor (ECF subfamily)